MHNMLMGPMWGIITVASIAGIVTIGCFALMFWFILRSGDKDRRRHPAKYDILRDDR